MENFGMSMKCFALSFVLLGVATCEAAVGPLRRAVGKAVGVVGKKGLNTLFKRASFGGVAAGSPFCGVSAPRTMVTWMGSGPRPVFTPAFVQAASTGDLECMNLFLADRARDMLQNFGDFIAEIERNKWGNDALQAAIAHNQQVALTTLLKFKQEVLNYCRERSIDPSRVLACFDVAHCSDKQRYEQMLIEVESLMAFLARQDVNTCYGEPGTCLKSGASERDFAECYAEGGCCRDAALKK